MTDKELKKLSRLELLELLLTESRENERLREELEKIKQENVIMKSVQYLNETSEILDQTAQKLGETLQQASLIIGSLNNVTGVIVEEEKDSSSDGVDINDEMNAIQEKQIVSETNEPEVTAEDESDSFDDEVVVNHGQSDISKRLDAILALVSSRIQEMDKLADLVDGNKEASVLYNVDEN